MRAETKHYREADFRSHLLNRLSDSTLGYINSQPYGQLAFISVSFL